MAQLLDMEIDGATIRGVFTPSEVEVVLAQLEEMADLRTAVPFGVMVGRPIGLPMDDDDGTSRPYVEHAKLCRDFYRTSFGFDPHDRVVDVLAPMAGGHPLLPAADDNGEYNPGQLRWMEPGLGGLSAHYGNEFLRLHRDGRKAGLFKTTDAINHLSYFAMLQRPDVGGTLSVFEALETTYQHPTGWADGVRDDSYFDSAPMRTLDPGPGDLLLFGGGHRWHRVEPIDGNRSRVTYGGFCARSIDGADVNFWT